MGVGLQYARYFSPTYKPMLRAAMLNDVECARSLLVAGADAACVNLWGETPLHLALTYAGNDVLVEILLAAGADVSRADRLGFTALDIAKRRKLEKIYEILVAEARWVVRRAWLQTCIF